MQKVKFTDINLSFLAHPISGDLVKVTNNESIKQSIKSLIKTEFYDRPFHPEIGCQAKGLLFQPISQITVEVLRTVIAEVLNNNEPRIKLIDIVVSIDDNEIQYKVDVIYTLQNTTESQKVTTYLKRVK